MLYFIDAGVGGQSSPLAKVPPGEKLPGQNFPRGELLPGGNSGLLQDILPPGKSSPRGSLSRDKLPPGGILSLGDSSPLWAKYPPQIYLPRK